MKDKIKRNFGQNDEFQKGKHSVIVPLWRNSGIINVIISETFFEWAKIHLPFPNKPWFLRVCSTSFLENTVGKGEIACKEQFLLFPHCFLTLLDNFLSFLSNLNYGLQTLTV